MLARRAVGLTRSSSQICHAQALHFSSTAAVRADFTHAASWLAPSSPTTSPAHNSHNLTQRHPPDAQTRINAF